MDSSEVVASKKVVYIIIALVLTILITLLVFSGKLSIPGFGKARNVDTSRLVAGSPEKFAVLSSHGTQENVGST